MFQLWLDSRRQPVKVGDTGPLEKSLPAIYKAEHEEKGRFLPAGTERPFNTATAITAVRILPHLGRYLIRNSYQKHPWHALLYLVGVLVDLISPLLRLQIMSGLLNSVQDTLQTQHSHSHNIFNYGFAALGFFTLEGLRKLYIGKSDKILLKSVNLDFELSYVQRKLSLEIPELADPMVSALMREAAVVVGMETMMLGSSGEMAIGYEEPFRFIQRNIVEPTIQLLGMGLAAGQLLNALLVLLRTPDLQVGNRIAVAIVVLLLSFLPFITVALGAVLSPSTLARVENRGLQLDKEGLKDMVRGTASGSREEIVLYGLGSWIAGRWKRLDEQASMRRVGGEVAERLEALGGFLSTDSGQVLFLVSRVLWTLSDVDDGLTDNKYIVDIGSYWLFTYRFETRFHPSLPEFRRSDDLPRYAVEGVLPSSSSGGHCICCMDGFRRAISSNLGRLIDHGGID